LLKFDKKVILCCDSWKAAYIENNPVMSFALLQLLQAQKQYLPT